MGLFSKLFGSANDSSIKLSYGDVVLLWLFENGHDIEDINYPRYFEYKYNIDPVQRCRYLIDKKFIVKAQSNIILKTLGMDELKKICKENGLKLAKKKADIINTLLQLPDIEKYLSNTVYCLSETGNELLRKNYDIVKYHKNTFDLDIFEFSSLLKKYGTYESAICHSFDINEFHHKETKNWGLYRCIKLNRARYAGLYGEYDKEMLYYIETFYCDLSGYENSNTRYALKELMIAPGIINYFPKHKQYYCKDMIKVAINDCSLPKHYFNEKSFKVIIEKLVNGEALNLKEILKIRLENK